MLMLPTRVPVFRPTHKAPTPFRPISTRSKVIAFCWLAFVFAIPANAGENAPANRSDSRPLTGVKWADMDYGPYLSATIESPHPAGNLACKGLMIEVDRATEAYQLFDADLMLWSAGWHGGRLNWTNIAFDGSHNTHMWMVGEQIFGNGRLPAWSDPRKQHADNRFADPRELPYGPMPRDWMHYRGLYLHGNDVILSYSLGSNSVFESPGFERFRSADILTRTINLEGPHPALIHQVVEAETDPVRVVSIESLQPIHSLTDATRSLILSGPLPSETESKQDVPVTPVIPDKGLIARWAFDEGQGHSATATQPELAAKLQKAKWSVGHTGQALALSGRGAAIVPASEQIQLGGADYTLCGWVKTNSGGTIASFTKDGAWVHGGKTLFIRDNRLCFDIGWVGVVTSSATISDGRWHHVAVTHQAKDGTAQLYVDGVADGRKHLQSVADPANSQLRFGYTSKNFPRRDANQLTGALDDVCVFNRVLSADEIADMCPQLIQPRSTAVAVVSGMSDELDLKWTIQEKQIRLQLPAASKATRIKLMIWQGHPHDLAAFADAVRTTQPPNDLESLTHGGPPRWKKTVVTHGELGNDADGAYVIDTLIAPMENPWHSWMRFGGFDFFSDGKRAAISTWNGDVWLVSDVDGDLQNLKWRRIATGLFHPLGLKIVDDTIYVCCRDQIARLHDFNGDDEIDFYESFNNDHQVTDHFHEWATGLETDKDGNFYYAKAARHAADAVVPQHGTFIRVSPDGKKTELLCYGFRAPNGVGIGPKGEWIVSDQEGHWTPANRLDLLKRGGFYGYMQAYPHFKPRTDYDPPICWLPKGVDRSPAEQLWVTSHQWGPLYGSLISTSYGTGQIFVVPYEMIGDVPQGAAVHLPLSFPTGIMRGRFHPDNGQLYTCGLYGWSSDKTYPGGFYRVRYTGKPVHMPVEFHVFSDGISVTFSDRLTKESAEDVNNYNLKQWNYRWTANYGSDHYRVSDPKRTGSDPVPVLAATLSADQKTVFLHIDGLIPVMQLQISYRLTGTDGSSVNQDLYSTLNVIPDRIGSKTPAMVNKTSTNQTPTKPTNWQSGLILRFHESSHSPATDAGDARVSRLAALHVPAGEPPTPFLPPTAFSAAFEGSVLIDLPGEYSFSMRGAGSAKLEINNRVVLEGTGVLSQLKSATVSLPRGHNAVRLTYTSLPNRAATVRLYWESESFCVEPVRPTQLFHDADDAELIRSQQLRQGRTLFATHHCARCHQLPAGLVKQERTMPEQTHDAPVLAGASGRLNGDWLFRWLVDPPTMRNKGLMPRLLHGDSAELQQQAADIVAYLLPEAERSNDQQTGIDSDLVDQGEILYEDLGCIACHKLTPPEEEDEFDRTSLAYVGKKFQSGELSRFLRDPHGRYQASRMPDFMLTEEEAAALSEYLRKYSRDLPEVTHAPPAGDSARGKQLFQTLGCANCHAIDANGTTATAVLASVLGAATEKSCLAPTASAKSGVPGFDFNSSDRAAVLMFLQTNGASLNRAVSAEIAERARIRLNCQACHQLDEQNATWPIVLTEEGSRGILPEPVPPFDWLSEKLKPDWIRRFLQNKIVDKPRPWLKARMPKFQREADDLAFGMAALHGYPKAESLRPDAPKPLNPLDQIKNGKSLTLNEVGFNCIQCHDIGKIPATSPFENRGVNFSVVPDRMRYDFYPRWMLDAPRIDISTKMPKLAPDRRKTELTAIYDGDAQKQFDAIWHYIHSLPPLHRTPTGE